ncbi:hypothetical protein Ait01nite_023210 [Actinoplanes italicus]|uniref:Uncharacterized protein n=1 Tax=Actinoplanes italicus TaxID=113567 RepID=A0A2T0KG09_9ACTN|nr:hypothetical protein [Actinoplanes italicus]PRX22301.1 hypothetical protein CLV67_105478 [Actinoplanes italicus]GIE29276.1 hypothetical protein Ait01nite_023210 [Actinoplanes italicus]
MPADEPARARRPASVTAAFRCQVAIALLLVVVAVVNAVDTVLTRRVHGDPLAGSFDDVVLYLVLAAWLGFAAPGLRRGRRPAYWLSLSGLLLPLAALASEFAFGTSTHHFAVYIGPVGDEDLVVLANTWSTVTSAVTGLGGVAILALMPAAVALLLTGSARGFFLRASPGTVQRDA